MSETTERKISRRTVAAGVAWATPVVAVASGAPFAAASVTTTTTTLPPCVQDIGATGGTYPVTYELSNCSADDSHWDFQFLITAALQSGTDCSDCNYLRVTLFDNPKRTRLWIVPTGNQTNQNNQIAIMGGHPNTNTNDYNRLYVQKVLAAGTSDVFPKQGDIVRRVSGPGGANNYTNYVTNPGTDAVVGPIEAHGDSNDTLHVLVTPSGGTPCSTSGPMAYFRAECAPTPNGSWTQMGGIGQINPCVPMISATVCRFDTEGNDRYRLGISVLNACGLEASDFLITSIDRNNNTNSPTSGANQVWSGSQPLSGGVTYLDMTTPGNNGGHLWISFTTDGGTNTSQIRVPTNNATCPAGPTTTTTTAAPPTLLTATNNQTSCPGFLGTRTINVTWSGAASKLQYRVANTNGNFTGDWTNQNVTGTSAVISLSGGGGGGNPSRCRAVQVQLCSSGNGQTCNGETDTITVPAL